MSYGDKYKFEYKDHLLGRRTTVIISEDGYTGEVEWVTAGANPVQIESKSDNNYILNQIYGSECTISIVSDASMKFVDLFNSNAFKYRVTIWKEPEPDEPQNVWWIGYLLPDEYSEPLDYYINYEVSLRARDVLGGLKTSDFLNENNQKYVGKAKVTTIIANCLRKTQLNLFINFSVNLEEVNFPGTIDPLDNIYLDYEAFYTEKTPNCEDVLNQILQSFGARIIMNRGSWWIQRIALFRSQHTVYVYGSDGTYYYNFLYNPKLTYTGKYDQTNNRLFFAEKKGQLEISPAFKEFKITQDFGRKKSILKNYSFEENATRQWELPIEVPGWKTVQNSYNNIGNIRLINKLDTYKTETDKFELFLNDTVGAYAESNAVNVTLTPTKRLRLRFELTVNSNYLEFRTEARIGKYWLKNDDYQIETLHYESIRDQEGNSSGTHQQYTYVYKVSTEITDNLLIKFTSGADGYYDGAVRLDNVLVDFIDEFNVEYPKDIEYSVLVDSNNNEKAEEIKSILGDIPKITDSEDMYIGGYWGFNGVEFIPTYSWVILGTDRLLSLMEILADAILDQYLRPKQKISGELMGNFDFNHTILIPFMGNKMYFPIRISLSDKYSKYDVEMIELLETDGEGGKVLATHVPEPISTDLGYLIKVT